MTVAGRFLDLPPEPHFPGRNARPDDSIFAPLKARLVGCDTPDALEESAIYAAGFDAFHAGYFWEAHELWEPVWLRLPPASRERHLLQGLIQLANAALKQRMGLGLASERILRRADTALDAAFIGTNKPVMGISRKNSTSLRSAATVL